MNLSCKTSVDNLWIKFIQSRPWKGTFSVLKEITRKIKVPVSYTFLQLGLFQIVSYCNILSNISMKLWKETIMFGYIYIILHCRLALCLRITLLFPNQAPDSNVFLSLCSLYSFFHSLISYKIQQ